MQCHRLLPLFFFALNLQALGQSFEPVVTYGSGGPDTYSLVVADVNGDGKPDLIVANSCVSGNCVNSAVGILLGNGDGTFQTVVNYPSGGWGDAAVAVADVNGDTKPDLLVANLCVSFANCTMGGSVSVLLGNGDGTFQTGNNYGSGGIDASSVAVADVNGDTKPDLIVGNYSSCSPCGDGVVSVLLGNGDGTFQKAVPYASGGVYAFSVAVADVNGDSKPDLLVANFNSDDANGSVGVLLGNGDGTFQTATTYSPGGAGAISVAVADVNRDGKLDLLVADQCVSNNNCNDGAVGVLLGSGDGTFQTALGYALGRTCGSSTSGSVAVSDVNGDGNPDLLVTNFCSSTVVSLLGNGDGTFQGAAAHDSGGHTTAVAVTDVNGDGKPDVIAANRCVDSKDCGGGAGNGSAGVLVNTSLKATTTTVVSSINPSNFGQAVTFTATVTPHLGGTPTGIVSFFDGTTNLGSSALTGSGVETLTTFTLPGGTHSITAIYSGDADFAPSTSPVLNQVVKPVPIVSLSPTSLNFGNQAVHKISAPQYVTLANTGNAPLDINSIASNSGDYSQTNNCPISPNILPVSSSCTIAVRFTPNATGPRIGSIIINDNAPDNPQTVGLTGNGVVSKVKLSTTSVVFGIQLVGTTSGAKTVKVTNTSTTSALNITGIALTADFILVTTANQCPTVGSIAPKASCNLAVKFSPTSVGTSYGTIAITDSDPASPHLVGLSGNATGVKLSVKKLNLGSVVVGQGSRVKTVTLSNLGSTPLNLTGITVEGANAGDFTQVNTCGSSLASGAKCFINVTFKPTAASTRSANISVADSDPTSPQTIALIGTGT